MLPKKKALTAAHASHIRVCRSRAYAHLPVDPALLWLPRDSPWPPRLQRVPFHFFGGEAFLSIEKPIGKALNGSDPVSIDPDPSQPPNKNLKC